MIYISTGGHSDQTFFDTVEQLHRHQINAFELSGGLYCEDLEKKLLSLKDQVSVVLHNYFPPPKEPFVFNLASLNEDIIEKSLSHAKKSIELSAMIDSGYYSFHAGYLIDPQVNELGKKIQKKTMNDRSQALDTFIKNTNDLAEYAAKKGVKLLIENNVLSAKNLESFGKNPLLMVDPEETEHIISSTHQNAHLLIDVAHLKVSANSLKFSKENYLKQFQDCVAAYHLSDNNGLEDSNEPVKNDSWFWDLLRPDLEYYSLEIYNCQDETLKEQLDLTTKRLNLDAC